ncbi:SRPBCC family protein [Nonlabens xiamenensis]|uniref:SRPBCC family protein n=1 Tax=Nonlabens xiamenensis TaxID=2341043 RepID=UPI000F613D49|nr:SRPBCC domain-containing protein [Nonlabens xiamenensis]
MKDRINITVEYNFPTSVVWKAITDKQAVSQWLMPCDIEPVVGHKFQFKTKSNLFFDGIIDCEVLEVVENKLLSYSWSGGPLSNTTVVFRLEEVDNKTILHFEHKGFDGLFNRFIVRKLLSNGWKSKILTENLTNYLQDNG